MRALLLLALAAQARFAITKINVTGNQRLAKDAIAVATGLRPGQQATQADINGAAQRLLDTGFLTSAQYKLTPAGGGYVLEFQVTEETHFTPAELDLPAIDDEAAWQWIQKRDGLLLRQIPGTEAATARYITAIEAYLKDLGRPVRVIARNEGDLDTGRSATLFRLASPPRVGYIVFEGNASVSSGELIAAVQRANPGRDFSPKLFNIIVARNLQPIYDKLGRLKTTYGAAKVDLTSPDEVTLTVPVRESSVYKLGSVSGIANAEAAAKSAKCPVGGVANWPLVGGCIREILKRQFSAKGHLRASIHSEREYHDDTNIVNLVLSAKPGPVIRLGELVLEGISPPDQTLAAAAFKLRPGDPIDEPYLDQFVSDIFPKLTTDVKSFSRVYKPAAQPDTQDIIFRFKP